MKYQLVFFYLLLAIPTWSQQIIEPCKFGQPLIDALQADYTPNNPLGYGPARDILYSQIDNNGLELSGIYTNFTVTLDPGQDPSISAFQNGQGINAEHVYPQSLGAGSEPAKSDLHNIFPSKVNVNEARGSCPFSEIEDNDTDRWFYQSIQVNNTPSTEIDNYSEKDDEDCTFEPREEVKGNIARAVFYFYAIYQSICDGLNPNFFPLQKEVLYQWHLADLPDAVEIERNQLIASQQGNFNPFILDSTLVQRAYFMPDASYPAGDPNCFSLTTATSEIETTHWVKLFSNVVQNEVLLTATSNQGTVSLYNLQGQLISEKALQLETRLELNDLLPNIYLLQVRSEGRQKTFLFLKN